MDFFTALFLTFCDVIFAFDDVILLSCDVTLDFEGFTFGRCKTCLAVKLVKFPFEFCDVVGAGFCDVTTGFCDITFGL